ncbi:actin-1-like [Danaus plexippus]|uniref:actin-1-like n=1 Tax=Danaus plexippus TaxID=13037 RepID=UPI002AB1D4C6|nr:actin-1-like [Danaus plexippus]
MAFEKPAVVLDNGSYYIKAGFACDNHPVAIFRSMVGRPNFSQRSLGQEYYDIFIGDEAIERIEDLELCHPIVEGRIVHWDNMEKIWHHVFYRELKAAPEDRAVISACGPTVDITEKIKCCEIFFETLNSPALCIQPQCSLAMYGSGTTTGLCVDIGHATTDVIPIFEGGMMKYAHMKTNLAGVQIADFIKKSLLDRSGSHTIKSPSTLEDVIKNCLYVTRNCAVTRKQYLKKYTLPGGEEIDVSHEAFMASELLFQPDLVKGEATDFLPLHEAVITSALKCDDELRLELYNNIVPCGGLATIPGLNERLELEIVKQVDKPIAILSSPEAYAVAWLGGATFAGLGDAQKMWISKKQFEEYGERIVRNKFL